MMAYNNPPYIAYDYYSTSFLIIQDLDLKEYEKEITVDIKEFTDYIQPNNVVESGEIDANYMEHLPYLENFNDENGTHIISVAVIHVEPMGLYGGKQSSLDALK